MCLGFLYRKKSQVLLKNDKNSSNFFDSFQSNVLSVSSIYHHSGKTKKVLLKDFELIALLGKGSFGSVILIKYQNKYYAMKILDKQYLALKNQKAHTMCERRIMQKIQNPFIVSLTFAFQTSRRLFLVMPFMQGGELFFHLRKCYKFSEKKAKFYLCELILALECLHQNKIVYRDIKPENVLVDDEGHIKMGDFGLAKENIHYGQQTKTLCGTPEYLAPEILLNKGHDKSVDWWSLGVLFYEMLNGSPPFHAKDRKVLFQKILNGEFELKPNFSPLAADLISALLVVDPKNRLGSSLNGSQQIKSHPFFADIDWVKVFYKRYKPPFVPLIESPMDLRNFDKNFVDTQLNQVNIPTESADEFTDTYKDFTLPININQT